MHHRVHLMIVTSLSMIMTFVLHCIMEHAPSRQSFLRFYWIDYFRDCGLYIRCVYNQGLKNKTCAYLVTRNDLFHQLLNGLVFYLVVMILYYCLKLINHVRNILFTLLAVEFLAQYVASLNLWFKIDILTIYWFVWQLVSLVLNWVWSLLLPPILIIEQGSFCVFAAIWAWMWHFMLYRYISLTFNLSCLWIFSIIDIFMCLHHRGRLYDSYLTNETFIPRKKCPPSTYFIKGVNKWKTSGSLGLIDFFVYNMLILLALPPSSSIITKICITFGSIVSVQIGSLLTHWLRSVVKILTAPGVPLPVITVSIYLFILNIIIPNNFNQCIEL